MNRADSTQSGFRGLPGFDVIAFDGPDAATFLQAQLASDVSALAEGEWHWSSWLSAQGRVQYLLLLLRTGPTAYVALVAHGRGVELVQRIGRYVLRAKLGIARALLQASGRIAGDHGDAARRYRPAVPRPASARTGSWTWAAARARLLRLGPDPGSTAGDAAWELADIDDGVPWIHAAAADRETPQALGLERLGAYSLHKGCYPGQEIVARTHFLGRSKRRLLRFRAGTGIAPATRRCTDRQRWRGRRHRGRRGPPPGTKSPAWRSCVASPAPSLATPDGTPVFLEELP